MSSWANILQGAALVGAGAGLSYVLFWQRDRNLKKARQLEADATLASAQTDAEIIVRDAQLAANEAARKSREELEQSFSARRSERIELEKRLSEREGLINSQLERVLQSEKALTDQANTLVERTAGLEKKERDLAKVRDELSDQLQKLSSLS